MRAVLKKTEAARAAAAAARASARNPIVPATGAALLTAGDSLVSLRTTRLDTEIEVSIPASVTEPGAVGLPARLLEEILSSLDAEEVAISTAGGLAELRGGSTRFELATVPPQDFPVPLLPPNDAPVLQADAAALCRALRRVLHAASTDETRPALCGVRVAHDGNRISLAATDGSRLAIVTLEAPEAQPAAFTLPLKAASDVAALFDRPDALEIQASGEVARFTVPGLRLSARLATGAFPSYSEIVQRASENETTLSVRADELLTATRLAAVTARDDWRTVTLQVEEGTLTIAASSEDLGASTVPLPVEASGRLPATVSLNSSYLQEALRACGPDRVTLLIGTPTSPVLIRSADGAYTELIAPVRISRS
jgi:DNA polymerase-3 subunit beta